MYALSPCQQLLWVQGSVSPSQFALLRGCRACPRRWGATSRGPVGHRPPPTPPPPPARALSSSSPASTAEVHRLQTDAFSGLGMNYKLPLPRRGNAPGPGPGGLRPGWESPPWSLRFPCRQRHGFFPAPLTRGSSTCLNHRPGRVFGLMLQGGCRRGHHDHRSKRGEFVVRGQAGLPAARARSSPGTELKDRSPQNLVA